MPLRDGIQHALRDADLRGASAPVRDLNGRIVAAINVSAPKVRMGDRLQALGRYVADAAAALSGQLGAS